MKKYIARIDKRWSCEALITEVEVEKETEHSVWLNGRRQAKRSEYVNYYDSWYDAHHALLSNQLNYIDSIRERLDVAETRLVEIEVMLP
jgi:hypothetical protein